MKKIIIWFIRKEGYVSNFYKDVEKYLKNKNS